MLQPSCASHHSPIHFAPLTVEDFFARGEQAANWKKEGTVDEERVKREKRETKIIDIDGEVRDAD